MNRTLKRLAERTLIAAGAAAVARIRCRGRVLVLAYHNIVPTGEQPEGDLNLHLPQREFARHLNLVRQTHDVVPLTSILDLASPRSRPRVAITFDDAYAGALSAGLEELVRRQMPATVFVAPGILGDVAWWDALADRGRGFVDEQARQHAIGELAGKGASILAWAGAKGLPVKINASSPRIATAAELERATVQPGITLGAHTWSHANLCALTGRELQNELAPPLEWLQSRFGCAIPWLSYPYGLWSPSVARAAAEAGYVGACRVDGGWVGSASRHMPHALPRLNVPSGLSLDGLELRLAGIGASR